MAAAAGPQARDFTALFFGVAACLAAIDVGILALYIAGLGRERPFLARRWSVADLFVGLQVVLVFAIGVGILGLIAMAILVPGALRTVEEAPSDLLFWLCLAPSLLAQEVALAGVPLVLVWLKYQAGAAELGFRKVSGRVWRPVAWGALLALALLPVNDLLETLCRHWLLDPSRVPFARFLHDLSEQTDALALLGNEIRRPVALAFLAVIIGVVGPVAEEVFFRGFAYRALKERFGLAAGLVLSALLFAAIHVNPVNFLPIFLMGLLLAWLYERTGSLATSIGLHCVNNLASLAVYLWAPHLNLWDRLFRG